MALIIAYGFQPDRKYNNNLYNAALDNNEIAVEHIGHLGKLRFSDLIICVKSSMLRYEGNCADVQEMNMQCCKAWDEKIREFCVDILPPPIRGLVRDSLVQPLMPQRELFSRTTLTYDVLKTKRF